HEGEIASRSAAAGWPRIAAACDRRHLGKRITLDKAMARAPAVGLQVIPPAIAQVRAKVFKRVLGVDVDIHDFQTGLRLGGLGAGRLAKLDVHGTISSTSS